MREEINLVNFDNKVPIELSVVRFDTLFRHMHSHVQLLLVLEGECDIFIEDTTYHAQPNDMVVINPRVFHHLFSDKYCSCIVMNIDQRGFGLEEEEASTIAFNLNTMAQENTKRHDQIRYLVYSIIKYNTMENVNSIYTNRAIAYSFFAQLINDFRVQTSLDVNKKEAMDTFNEIGAWLTDHFKENVSLQRIADTFHYSVSYLSRMCRAISGKSFTNLYDNLRVNYSLNDLLSTNKTIEEIAESNGFENARSYVRAFNSIHNVNPSIYRKRYFKSNPNIAKIDRKIFKKRTLDKILSQYDSFMDAKNVSKQEDATRKTALIHQINVTGETSKLNFKGSEIIELSTAGDLFNIEIQDAILAAKKDWDFKYIMCPHVLSTKSPLISKDEKGHWTINFVYADKLISKIISFKAKPYLIFEYEPSLLKPGEFFGLLLQILEYIKAYYAQEAKDSMITFTISRDSNIKEYSIIDGQYFFLYTDLFREFKRELPGIKIGTPIFYKDDIYKKESTDIHDIELCEFLNKCKEQGIDFDFIPIRYTYDYKDNGYFTTDKDEMKHFIKYLKDHNAYIPNKMCFQGVNFTNNDSLLHDTVYESSFLIKNYLDNFQDIIGFSKSSLQDKKMLSAYDANPFHGEPGLFTYNLIKKASYNAYEFLSRLGPDILKLDKGYIATKKDNKIIILITNYTHYSDLFAEKEYFEIENLNRYNCFPKGTNIHYVFDLQNVKFTDAKVKISTISRKNGSSYDKWLAMGAIKNLSPVELRSINHLSEIYFEGSEEIISNKSLSIDVNVEPLESKLIEVELLNIN